MNKVPFTFEEYADSMSRLYRKLATIEPSIDQVLGISNGGASPAWFLAAIFGKHLVMIDPKKPIHYRITGRALLVDEICDTGATFLKVLEALRACNDDPHITTLSIHRRHSSLYTPDYYDILIPNDDWIVYSWEQQE